MQPSDSQPASGGDPVRTAFHDIHGTRLHGFALLLTLGDRSLAARLTADALGAGSSRVNDLSHPERAAAWLRRRVLDGARRHRRSGADGQSALRGTLAALGADGAVHAGLAELDPRQRAALIADVIERLDRRDVGTIVDRDGAALTRLLVRARRRFTAGHASATRSGGPKGPISELVRTTAAKALG